MASEKTSASGTRVHLSVFVWPAWRGQSKRAFCRRAQTDTTFCPYRQLAERERHLWSARTNGSDTWEQPTAHTGMVTGNWYRNVTYPLVLSRGLSTPRSSAKVPLYRPTPGTLAKPSRRVPYLFSSTPSFRVCTHSTTDFLRFQCCIYIVTVSRLHGYLHISLLWLAGLPSSPVMPPPAYLDPGGTGRWALRPMSLAGLPGFL